jgi:hypothetical protein
LTFFVQNEQMRENQKLIYLSEILNIEEYL